MNNKPLINKAIAAALFGFLGASTLMLSYRYAKGGIGRHHQVSYKKLRMMIKHKDVQLVNVLGKDTYRDCHIAGNSYNIPLKNLMKNPEKATRKLDLNKPVVIYCSSYKCGASKAAFRYFKELGFEAKLYEGGTNEWLHKGGKTEGPCQLDYLKKPVKYSARHKAQSR